MPMTWTAKQGKWNEAGGFVFEMMWYLQVKVCRPKISHFIRYNCMDTI